VAVERDANKRERRMIEIGGGCQCGAVRYTLAGRRAVYACHCRECQRQSGSAFALSLPVPRDQLALTGALAVWTRAADSGARSECSFCVVCGTRVHHASTTSPDWVTIKAGTLDDTRDLLPFAHLWVRSRQPWVVLDPAVARFDTQPADLAGWRQQVVALPTDQPLAARQAAVHKGE